ncbi:MAG TPA: serine hydrolase domain-containing protein [Polyangiales bacterium]|nr:serine hydrolase domain-containing protein [Polyangiales bacterium]
MPKPQEVSVRELEALLILGLREHTFPGAVIAAGRLTGRGHARVQACAGVLAPGEAKVELATPYDLASLTKPVVALTALRLSQRGALELERDVSYYLPELEGTRGGEASLTQLLSHRAGLAAWVPLWEEGDAPFGSAARKAQMLRSAATKRAEGLPEGGCLYSDLGYILAGETIARASGLSLEEAVRREVTGPLGIDAQLFYAAALRQRSTFVATVAPTEICPPRTTVARGEVHDENCFAYGGIAGHAGMFGSAAAVLTLGLEVLLALEGRSRWLDQGLLTWALRARGTNTHAVGWDTKSAEGSSAGHEFSALSFGHLGFTGTSIWCDPTRRLCAVLLSNRVHPSRENIAIRDFRRRFHDAVAELQFTEAV